MLRPIAYFINFLTGIVETLLGLRILLKFLGANPSTPFVRGIYDLTLPLIRPFAGMFPSPVADGQYVIEFSTIFALVIYALLSYFLVEILLVSVFMPGRRRVVHTVDDADEIIEI